MLTRPYDRPKAEDDEETPEPISYVEIEVLDIEIQYPDKVLAVACLRESKGDTWAYKIIGGQVCIVVKQGDVESIFHLPQAFYHSFRKRTVKVPAPKYVPPSADALVAPLPV